MRLSAGQRQAVREVQAVVAASAGSLELVRVVEPGEDDARLMLDVSFACAFERREGGLRLRAHERLRIYVPSTFPFTVPSVYVSHTRWAGAPHVQWGNYLCLYQSPMVEWNPSDGMYGYLQRLELWLQRAAVGELDPDGGPLHPPAIYGIADDAPLVIPRRDTPPVQDSPWMGWAIADPVSERRVDLIDWVPARDADGSMNSRPDDAVAAFLLPGAWNWEYPDRTVALFVALVKAGIGFRDLLIHLQRGALAVKQGAPMLVVVGTAMRGTAGGQRRQHLAVWRIPAEAAADLRLALAKYLDDEEGQQIGREAEDRTFTWLESASIGWCPVREERPEIVIRRDTGSPLEAFAGKSVAIWGCGALGAPVAQWIARAGAREMTLIDTGSVTPGILVRQPFTDADIGRGKAEVLAEQLAAIRPDLVVRPLVRDLVRRLDVEADWSDGADIVIDCSANQAVRIKLESVRRENPTPATVACMLVGHQAQNAITVLARPGHSGGPADVLRATKLACLRRNDLRDYAQEFWPATPRTEVFQPEPGCSAATFRGSGAEAAALAGTLLTALAADLTAETPETSAVARLHSLPTAEHGGPRDVRLTFEPALLARSDGDDYQVRLAPAALRQLRGWIAAGARTLGPASETGGLLWGERDPAAGVIWIEEASGPPPDSIQTPAEFVCGTAGNEQRSQENKKLGQGSLGFLGIWHTHPEQDSTPSMRDLQGMVQLLSQTPGASGERLIVIVGHTRALTDRPDGPPADLSTYLFDGQLDRHGLTVRVDDVEIVPLPARRAAPAREIGLALSGGGSRAIAFHLGCLRAMNDLGLLDRVRVISSVSGGSVLAALYAYRDQPFDSFDAQVQHLLARGLQRDIAARTLLSKRLLQAGGTRMIAGTAAATARAASVVRRRHAPARPTAPPLRRWVSRTDAFVDVLDQRLYHGARLPEVAREGLDVVINACELSTGSAFRFGSRHSATWRIGEIVDNDVSVAEAVAASAAYPLLLPALDRRWRFRTREGQVVSERVALTDGGVYDNLGTTSLEPGRTEQFSSNVYPVDFIIACDAGRGLLDPTIPFGAGSRLARSFTATFRKAQDATRARLHAQVEHGQLTGFVMPYLGQRDKRLPHRPPDLVGREQVVDYPTDFAAMSEETIALLAGRGEQLTRILLHHWLPQL